ncbi:NADH-quinone oxidoreductase subunit A [Fulvitalea axinellae]|uniref:NADH-quinone oxidoreductase subunit A n=1 Tax=Fulvitalea axinellae TaxID=1182444 RepID=A0AAU9CG57_9BACT|nr:NADH-quinone oxidoreductase subunit A [Fulvitalea axinellae]
MANPGISAFGEILLYIIGGVGFCAATLFAGRIFRPNRPNDEKLTTYECGEDPVGTGWGRFNMRFYVIALLFILFDVEIVFLFPWATVFGNKEMVESTDGLWAMFSITEMFVFILILVAGLAYAWAKGFLNWEKPNVKPEAFKSSVPQNLYENLNGKY